MCLSWAFVENAAASAPIKSYSAIPSSTQAGGHPDIEVAFAVENRVLQKSESPCNCEDAKDADIHLPAGFIGNPHATPQCTVAEFSADECPVDSQVGIVNVLARTGVGFELAVYNIVPPPEDAGLLGFKIILFDAPQFTVLGARTGGDYGLDADTTSIFHGSRPAGSAPGGPLGGPADPSHDLLRIDPRNSPSAKALLYLGALCDANGVASTTDPKTVVKPCIQELPGPPQPPTARCTPFLQNPTTCDTALESYARRPLLRRRQRPRRDPWPSRPAATSSASTRASTRSRRRAETDSPSGIDVDLTVPQQLSPTLPSPTELRGATVTLPEGFSINPNAADGKTACQDTERASAPSTPPTAPSSRRSAA